MKHPMQEMMDRRRNGELTGIPSYCTANELVLEAALIRAKKTGKPVLIEATANQVNQFGGYTGMKPKDYYAMIMELAKKHGVPENQVILGGDHLGPLTWQKDTEEEAMAKSEELVYQYVLAGFTKIHLDTSMKVADDPEGILSTETIARRGARLYKVCMKAYEERLKEYPDAMRPVFVVGSEVPIPGGAQEEEDTLAVTRPEAFADTVDTYKKAFADAGVPDGMQDVIAVVVQPGVEFGDDQVFYYNSSNAKELCDKLKEYPNLIFEGHSTDYQTAESLRDMVIDGIAILKVGPAVTYGIREGLFALSMMEKELVPAGKRASLIETIDEVMTDDPGNWQNHYHGTYKQVALARKYSYSDRVRYYMNDPRIQDAIRKLFDNLVEYKIPMNMLHQYMPIQYRKVCRGELTLAPKDLAMDGAVQFMEDYEFAAQQ
ncbi:MAG: class II D-tagatose-bisphosphate aldolase, non-catalytic subunit [Eubacteriales bacterium]|nr:class II D-tagatose-bisphosphate aldolase, non-catalytic subunit [Eubacteriales bacterium]